MDIGHIGRQSDLQSGLSIASVFFGCASASPEFGPTYGQRKHDKPRPVRVFLAALYGVLDKTAPNPQQRYAQPSRYAYKGHDTCVQVPNNLSNLSVRLYHASTHLFSAASLLLA